MGDVGVARFALLTSVVVLCGCERPTNQGKSFSERFALTALSRGSNSGESSDWASDPTARDRRTGAVWLPVAVVGSCAEVVAAVPVAGALLLFTLVVPAPS